MACKIMFCSEFPDIPGKAGRKATGRRTQAIAKRYAFHANAINYDTDFTAHIKDQKLFVLFPAFLLNIEQLTAK